MVVAADFGVAVTQTPSGFPFLCWNECVRTPLGIASVLFSGPPPLFVSFFGIRQESFNANSRNSIQISLSLKWEFIDLFNW